MSLHSGLPATKDARTLSAVERHMVGQLQIVVRRRNGNPCVATSVVTDVRLDVHLKRGNGITRKSPFSRLALPSGQYAIERVAQEIDAD
jgi:hypothetical protein